MSDLITLSIHAALVIMVLLIVPCTWIVVRGRTEANRLQGIDIVTTLLIGIVLLLALSQQSTLTVDISLALAAFSFIGTVAIARFICEGKVF